MSFETFMHWFWVAIFAGFGIFLLANPFRFRNIEAYFCPLSLPAPLKERLLDAAMRRKSMENLSPNLGRTAGVLSLLLALIGALVPIPPIVLYAVFCLGFPGFLGVAYLQLRNRQTKRVAQIDVRTAFTVLPTYWYGVAVVAALLPTVDLRSATLRIPAAIVIFCAFALIVTAWRLATMPALLSGDDVPVERFVDDRLRFIRTATTLIFAPGVVFVYFSQMYEHSSRVHDYLGPAAALIWLTLFITFYFLYRRAPSAEELDRWQSPA
jgi:hypothetical protein